MRIGVIGAGASGLVVGRRLKEDIPGADFIIFEQADRIGGTWVYTDEQFEDEHGLPIHSSMYKSLRTNIPKETMEFFGFPFDKRHGCTSYLHNADVVEYLEQYTKHFQLKENIKFRHHVTSIQPLPDERWRITVINLLKAQKAQFDFDAVFICNGHYHLPNYIEIEGQDTFEGVQLHSHHYRYPEPYQDKRVLVIGSGPSGSDISIELASTSKCVYLSHHDQNVDLLKFPDNVIKKSDVRRLSKESVEFVDDSVSYDVDAIIYCTGYRMNMPFLTPECGLQINHFSVQPLFFHVVNINHPTMFIVGLVSQSIVFPLLEMQAQFCMNVLNGSILLPAKEDMLNILGKNVEMQISRKKPHLLCEKQEDYLNLLHEFAKTNIYEPVVFKIYKDSMLRKKADRLNFRSDVYVVLDKDTFYRTSDDVNANESNVTPKNNASETIT